jgi:energy-coupling factor transporter ATP-binding protein EcfA2
MRSHWWNVYIPGFGLSIKKIEKICYVLNVKIGKKRHVQITQKQGTYMNTTISAIDIVTLADYILERERQKQNLFSLHGDAIKIKNKALVFFGGASGIGKTTVARSLASMIPESSLLGNERIVIDGNGYIVAAAKGKLEEAKCHTIKKLDAPIKIGAFIQPILVPCKEGKIYKWNPNKLDWHLYEEMTRRIRGTARRIFNLSFPLPSLDTPMLAQKRIKIAAKISHMIPGAFICGDIKFIKTKSLELLR